MPPSTTVNSSARKRVHPQNALKVSRYTNATEIRSALKIQEHGALTEALMNLRNQLTIRSAESSISPQDERLLLCQNWLESSLGAKDLFDVWERTEQRQTSLLAPLVSVFAALLTLLSTHLPYHGYGHAILKTLLSPASMRRINSYTGGSHIELTLVTLKLLNAMSAFAGGKERKALLEGFAWDAKACALYLPQALSKLLQMRRKAKAEQGPDPLEWPDIRTLYLLFLLSFIDSDTPSQLKTTFLEHHQDAFRSIFKGLPDDHYNVVRRILEVCWTSLWSDVKLKRTIKVNLFNELTIAQLCRLYERSQPENDNIDHIPADLVHHFLLAICTRPGTGICFKDRGWYPRETEEEASLAKDEALNQAKGSRIYNKILANILKTLKVNEDPRQQELALKIMTGCPELVASYWHAANLTLEPRLSSRWIANVAFFGSVISLPVPSASFYLPDSNLYHPTPPPLSTIIENVLPSINTKVHFSKGLQSTSALVQHSTALALAKCLLKFEAVSQEMAKVEASLEENADEGQWYKRRKDLEREVRRRVPDFQVIVAFSQQKHDESKASPTRIALLAESAQRLLWLYHRCLPGLVSEARFDVGKSLLHISEVYSTQSHEADDSDQATVARLNAIQQLHSLRLLKESNQFNWTGKASGSSHSYLYVLLKAFTNARVRAIRVAVTDLLHHILGETILFQEDPDEVDLWLKSLSLLKRSEGAKSPDGSHLSNEEDSVLPFLDECVQRCMKTPYKYIEELYALQSGTQDVLQQHLSLYPSPLIMTVLEQLEAKVANSLLSPSDVLALASFARRLVLRLVGKQSDLALLRSYSTRIDDALASKKLFADHPCMTSAIRREVDMLQLILAPGSFCVEVMDVSVPPSPEVERFLLGIEATSTAQTGPSSVTSAYEIVDWVRISDAPISESQHLRLASVIESLHAPALRQLAENLDVRNNKLIWAVFGKEYAQRSQYLDFDVLIPYCKEAEVNSDAHRNLLLQVLFSHKPTLVELKRAIRHLEHALLESIGRVAVRKNLLHLLSTMLHLAERTINHTDHVILKRAVFVNEGVVKDMYLAQDISVEEAEALNMVSTNLDPNDDEDKDIAKDLSQQWLTGVKATLSERQSSEAFLLLPWIQYLPASDLFELLELLVPNVTNEPPQFVVTLFESVLRSLYHDSSSESRLTERLPQLLSLRPSLPRSSFLEDVIALAINASLPLALSGDLQTSGSIPSLVSRAKLRWTKRLTKLSAEYDFQQFLEQSPWSDSTADIVSGLLYRGCLDSQALLSWLSTTHSAQRSIRHLVKVALAFLDVSQSMELDATVSENAWSAHIPRFVAALQDEHLPLGVRMQCITCLSRIAGSKAAPVKLIVSQLAKRIKALQPTQLPIQFVQLTAQLRTLPSASDKLLEAVVEHGLGYAVRQLAHGADEQENTHIFKELANLVGQSTAVVKANQVETLLSVVTQQHLGNVAALQLATSAIDSVHLKPATVNRYLQSIIQHPQFFRFCGPGPSLTPIREQIVDLLHKLFNLHPTNTCQPSHINPLVQIYCGTLSAADTKIFSIFHLFEQERKLSATSVLARWNSNSSVVSDTSLEALQSLDPVLVLRTSLNFPHHRRFDTILQEHLDPHITPLYDPLFLLLLFAHMLTTCPPTSSLIWVELFRTNVVGLLIRMLSSNDGQIRGLALSQLGALWKHLEAKDMQEQPQVHYILSMLKDTYSSPPTADGYPIRLPSYSSLILLHALRAIFYPSNFIYPLTSRFLLQRPELDIKDVPMLYGMLYSNSDDWKKERGWILRFLADGMMSTDDWKVLKKRHTWDLLASLFQSAENDHNLRNSIFEVFANLTCNQQAATSLVLKTSLLTWIEMQLLTISPTLRQKEGMVWLKILENIVTVVDPARIEASSGGIWRETICQCVRLLLEGCTLARAAEILSLAAPIILRCGLMATTPPLGLPRTLKCAVICLNKFEESINLDSGQEIMANESPSPRLPPYKSYAIHEPSHIKNTAEGWGHVVEILWQASMLLDDPTQWSELTSRMLLVRALRGEEGSRLVEWVRKEIILDVGESAPAKQVAAPKTPQLAHIDGSFANPDKIRELAAKVDVLTVEIEHVDVSTLEEIEKAPRSTPLSIHPSPSTVKIIQDKFKQKEHLSAHGCPISSFVRVDSTVESVSAAIDKLGLPLMLKSRTLAYDGRGNYAIRELSQVADAISALGNRPLYAEKWVPFTKEIAVMVVRTVDGQVLSYPAVETVHKENICHLVFAPLRSRDPGLARRAQSVAEAAVQSFSGAGVFGVEMFLLNSGDIYVNEIAPRPHNSGHYTIEACETSQYENHLRAILSLPLGSTALKVPSAVMLNLIGHSSSMSEILETVNAAVTVPGATVHLYGKSECRKGRKMGHITVVAESDAQLRSRLRPLLETLPSSSEEKDLYAPLPPSIGSGFSNKDPLVGIIMGSDSDLPVMLAGARILDRFEIPYELTIVSAHRTPARLVDYANSAASRGLRTIIAGAGGAAHLPGMVAAMTPLPVIGVPVKGSTLGGVDSLHSIVQMPRGVPVATVAINNSTNAGLLAVRILSAGIPRLIDSMEKYMQQMEDEVLGKVGKLETVGWEKYQVSK
ncbi:hypothetical protein AX16_000179 [Volvariella volvacea WC 439]|nr:hypothetical protein AX16_000179 [Volvariella volvacea WC 439]